MDFGVFYDGTSDSSSRDLSESITGIVNTIALAVLLVKLVYVTFLTGYARKKSGKFASSEDGKKNASAVGTESEGLLNGAGESQVDRMLNIHRNDIENVVFYLIAFMMALYSEMDLWALMTFTIIFVLARVAHTICYMLALQPWRSISFGIGFLSCLLIGFSSIIYAFVRLT